MPKSILGLQLGQDKASAVKIKNMWKGFQVEAVVQSQDAESLLSNPLQADAVFTALPCSRVFRRLVSAPFSDKAKIAAAAPLEAEESLPLPLEDLVFDFHILNRRAGKSEVLFFASPSEHVSALLGRLGRHGVEPGLLDAEPLALANIARFSLLPGMAGFVIDLNPEGCQGVYLDENGSCSVYSFSEKGGAALRDEAARCLMQNVLNEKQLSIFLSGPDALGQDLDEWSNAFGSGVKLLPFPPDGTIEDPSARELWPGWAIPLGLALRDVYPRDCYNINLLQGPFEPVREETSRKLAMIALGVYFCISAALWGSGVWVETSNKEMQYKQLKQSLSAAIEKSLPGVKVPPGAELAVMEKELKSLSARAAALGSLVDAEVSPLRILKELSARISKTPEVEISKFSIKEGRVFLEGSTGSFDAVDKIAAEIGGYQRFVSVKVAHTEKKLGSDKVLFKLAIDTKLEG